MKVKKRHYPHPVIWKGTDAFINCEYKVNINSDFSNDKYVFTVECIVTSEYIKRLIREKKAVYTIHLESKNTRYRKLVQSYEENFTFKILAANLDGKVEMCSFILSTNDISDYNDPSFHPDYDNISFNVLKGDPIAIGEEFNFYVDKEIDPLVKIPSIITICRNDEQNAPPMHVYTDTDRINIMLNKNIHEQYAMVRNTQNDYYNLSALLCTMIIIPALVCVLEDLKRQILETDDIESFIESQEDNHRWFRVLKAKLYEVDVDIRQYDDFIQMPTLTVAQELIGNPLIAALKFFNEISNTEGE